MNIGSITYSFRSKSALDEDIYSLVKFQDKMAAHTATIQDDYKQIQEMCLNSKKQKELEGWMSKKRKSTYFKIDDSYANCEFLKGTWLK
jgi:peptidyl-prolyl cis-trans isomerase SurA